MTNKKLPRDFVGIVFYVFGWIIGMLLKGFFYSARFALRAVYAIFKRDQLNRRLRLIQHKLDCETNARTRSLGREELRHLSAVIGLTDAEWHKSVKLRRRVLETLKSAGENAAATGDLNQSEAAGWVAETTRLLFTNFDQNLLTAENKPNKKRVYRLSKKQFLKKVKLGKDETIKEEAEISETAEEKAPSLTDRGNGYQSTKISPDLPNLQIGNISSLSASEWANNEEEESAFSEEN